MWPAAEAQGTAPALETSQERAGLANISASQPVRGSADTPRTHLGKKKKKKKAPRSSSRLLPKANEGSNFKLSNREEQTLAEKLPGRGGAGCGLQGLPELGEEAPA